MKISVSVPDELWDAARAAIESDSPSGVVQEALRRVTVAHSAEVGYAQPPDMDAVLVATLSATRQRLLDEARDLYQAGYRSGLELADQLQWSQLSWIVRSGILAVARAVANLDQDIQMGRPELPADARPLIELVLLQRYVGRYADFTDGVEWSPPTETVEGMDRALRDVWDQVRAPASTS